MTQPPPLDRNSGAARLEVAASGYVHLASSSRRRRTDWCWAVDAVNGDPDDAVARELRRYVERVVHALGLSGRSSRHDTGPPATARIALDGRLSSHPDHVVALTWDEHRGWAVVLDGDPAVVASLRDRTVPRPSEVARFAARVLRGDRPGDPRPGRWRCRGPSLLTRLRTANRAEAEGLVTVRSTRSRDAIVTVVTGEVDTATAGTVHAELVAQLAKRPAALVVDLDGVVFLGARGVAVLVDVDRRARHRHVLLAVVATADRVLKPLLITGADHVLHVSPLVRRAGA